MRTKKTKKINSGVLLLSILILASSLLSSCAIYVEAAQEEERQIVEIAPVPDINSLPLMNDRSIHDMEADPASIIYLYLTVMPGAASDYADFTWERINQTINRFGVVNPTIRANALLQQGDENGPVYGMFGYGLVMPNATVSVRGQSSTRYAYQKSYRVLLFDEAEAFRGTRNVALNNHSFDATRIRNKLAWDLLRELPGIVVARTQFVHLFVKDLTAYPPHATFVDYGLFTHVEIMNRAFLRNHGLCPDGHLYKIRHFNFNEYDALRLQTDPYFDHDSFDLIISPRARTNDHQKLLDFLAVINDYSIDIEYILENYIDLESYTTWMAFNLLFGNYDFINQNYFIYSPLNSTRWYFFHWDMDMVFWNPEVLDRLLSPRGLSILWEVVLHRRAFKSDTFLNALIERMDLIMEIVTPEKVEELMALYYPVVAPFFLRPPDNRQYVFSDGTPDKSYFYADWNSFAHRLEIYKEFFLSSLNYPQPFFVGEPEIMEDGRILFSWEAAFHFNNERMFYDFTLANDIFFEDIIVEQNNLIPTMALLDISLPPGNYYFKISVRDTQGNETDAYLRTVDPLDRRNFLFGVSFFEITEDGELIYRP